MQFFNLHTHHYTNQPNTLELFNQYPWAFDDTIPNYSIGIHPWYIEEKRVDSDLAIINEKIQVPQCLALGECGLDKRIDIPMQLQLEVFEKQISIAETHQKPLVLHLVAAFDELLALKKNLAITVPIIIHGFSKNQQLAKQLLDQGCYLSFGKYLMLNPDLKSVFQYVPNDRFFLETDTMAEPLEAVYQRAADYKNISLEALQKQVSDNFEKVFD